MPELRLAAELIVQEIVSRKIDRPFLVAIDGGSGSVKSTIAAAVADRLGAALVPTDDFFAAAITDESWHVRPPEQRATDAIGWRRLKRDVLQPLRQGKVARWFAFDFAGGRRADGNHAMSPVLKSQSPGGIILIEGTYSARPELAHMFDLTVLIDSTLSERHRRLSEREGHEVLKAWHSRWDGAENLYFSQVGPSSAFDLVVRNS